MYKQSYKFDIFYGRLENAPMIRECEGNMELKLHQVLDFKTHDMIIGGVSKNAVLAHYFLPNFLDLKKLNKTLCNKGFWNHYGWPKNWAKKICKFRRPRL